MMLSVPPLENTKREALRRYTPRYTVSLRPTPENLDAAMVVYYWGVSNRTSLYKAVIDVYGYRYRRMENFIRELGLYLTGYRWLLPFILTKIYTEYRGDRSIKIELYVWHCVPEWMVGRNEQKNCEKLFEDILREKEAREDWEWLGGLTFGKIKVGDDPREWRNWDYWEALGDYQVAAVRWVVWKGTKIIADEHGLIDLYDFALHKKTPAGVVIWKWH